MTFTDWMSMTCCAMVETFSAMALATFAAPAESALVTESEITREVVSDVTLTLYPLRSLRPREWAVSFVTRSELSSVATSLVTICEALRSE